MKIHFKTIGIIFLFSSTLRLVAQNFPDISGTWYSNGVAGAPAKITQNGNQLTFNYKESNSTGYFSASNKIIALEWNTSATIETDGQTITWDSQVWKRNVTPQTYPDISGTWYMNSDPSAPCQISQNGFNLSFSFTNNHSEGYYYEMNKIYAKDWNAYGEVSADHSTITWNNQSWTRSSSGAANKQVEDKGRYCRKQLSMFYYAAQSMGAVWGRGATEPPMPTTEAIMAMEAHLDLALAVLTSMTCIHYDYSKMRSLRSQLHQVSSRQITDQMNDIIHALQIAIGQAGFRCDNGVDPLALYVAGINLGAAQAWASAQQCRTAPMQGIIQNTIQNHLNTAQTALRPYSSCIPDFDFGNFARIPLNSSNSIAPHTFIVGTETQLLWAIALSDCCCSCASVEKNQGSDCDATCKEYCRQQGYQNGRFNGKTICLLGQVSGGVHEGCDCSN